MQSLRCSFALALVLLSGCNWGTLDGTGSRARPAPTDPGLAVAKDSMELQALPMLPAMRAHLDSDNSGGAMTQASTPQHRQRVRHFVEATKSDMQRMGMHSDPAYEALTDSVLRGLDRLTTARGTNLERLAEHIERRSASPRYMSVWWWPLNDSPPQDGDAPQRPLSRMPAQPPDPPDQDGLNRQPQPEHQLPPPERSARPVKLEHLDVRG